MSTGENTSEGWSSSSGGGGSVGSSSNRGNGENWGGNRGFGTSENVSEGYSETMENLIEPAWFSHGGLRRLIT